MRKLFTPLTALLVCLSTNNIQSQNFTVIDTLPVGAYGTADWGDFDGDGWKDLVYITQAPPTAICKVYHNIGNVFTEIKQYLPYLYNPAAKWADLNNDGFDDLVLNGADSALVNRTFIYKSMGDGTFVFMPNTVFPLSAGSVDVADYNNDGLKDIAVAGMDSVGNNCAYMYKNTGAFKFSKINVSLSGIHFGELKWGDYNRDHLPDLIVNGIGNMDFRVRIYKNMGADSFQLQPFYMKGSAGTVDWADMDKDGWLDILVTGYDSSFGSNFTQVHHNNQNGTFAVLPTNLPAFGEPSSVAIADFDLDVHLDVCFIGGSDFLIENSAMALQNKFDSFTVQQFFRGDIQNAIVASSDIDNDGDEDLLFSNFIIRNDVDKGTGLGNLQGKTNISLYPNPANDRLMIQSDMEFQSIVLYDVAGNEMKADAGSSNHELMMNDLEAAVYVVKIQFADGTSSFRKIIVSH